MFKFILRDSCSSDFDDLITFENKVNKYDVINLIENLKKNDLCICITESLCYIPETDIVSQL